MVIDCVKHTGADASGDIFHEWVHHSLLLFCLHPVKMAEPVQRSLSSGVSVVRFASWPVTGIATLGNRADARGSFVPLGLAHNLLTSTSFVDQIPSCMLSVFRS
jgi:hypothetical protein